MRPNPEEVRSRVLKTREVMERHDVHTLIIPTSDPHVTEYVPAHWQGRRWLSGFTGSLGILVITPENAFLLAPDLYRLQADNELSGTGIELRINSFASPDIIFDWVADSVPSGKTLSVDGDVLPNAQAESLKRIASGAGVELRLDIDLLDEAWPDRPPMPAGKVFEQPAPQATPSRLQKLANIRTDMAAAGATHYFISSLDDIAWLLNLRGSDIQCTPLFMSHLMVEATAASLFVGDGCVDSELKAKLLADGVSVSLYEDASTALSALATGDRLLIDPKKTTSGFLDAVSEDSSVVEATNPTTLRKSRKTDDELGHVREAMAEDGAALCEFYAWFETALGHERITELTVDERMTEERARRDGFVSLSFPTIAGFNGNGAMPHYGATPESHSVIEGNGLLLIDSGGQYHGATTDITRVWPIGSINDAQKRDFTLVLKANIALSRTRFPVNTLSTLLDSIARVPLWSEGMDYAHGTGHGVGYFLCVHEGPHTIRQAIPNEEMAMKAGMITSIEPAVYRVGQWGVRHENLVANVPVDTSEGSTYGEFLEFETLTMCPIDTRCINRSLMRDDEIDWLNRYHAVVRERLSARVSKSARDWLETRTRAI